MLGSAIHRRIPDAVGFGSANLDLTNQEETRLVLKFLHPTTIYHCAGLVGGIMDNYDRPYDYLMKNSQMAINVIDAAARIGVKNLIYMSSSCVYPTDAPQPMREGYILRGPLEETNKGYALAKILGSEACDAVNKMYGYNYKTMVPCNLYGPGDDFSESGHVLASLVKRICDAKRNNEESITVWGDGTPRREFLHVDDAAAAIITACDIDADIINIGSGKDISIQELTSLIAEIVGWEGIVIYDESKPNGMMRKLLDIHHLNEVGWSYNIPLRTGIKEMVETYEANPSV